MGRCARPGSPHAEVHVHALRPAAAEARWLRLAARLRAKRRAARAVVPSRAMPDARIARWAERCLMAAGALPPAPTTHDALPHDALPHDAMPNGARPDGAPARRRAPMLAVASPGLLATRRGPIVALAAVQPSSGGPRLVALVARDAPPRPARGDRPVGPSPAPRIRACHDAPTVARALAALDRATRAHAVPRDTRAGLVAALRRWCRADRASAALRPSAHATASDAAAGTRPSPVVAATLARLATLLRDAPAHRRAERASLAAALHARLAAPVSAGLEATLRTALAHPDADATLAALRDALRCERAEPPRAPAGPSPARLLALVAFTPPDPPPTDRPPHGTGG